MSVGMERYYKEEEDTASKSQTNRASLVLSEEAVSRRGISKSISLVRPLVCLFSRGCCLHKIIIFFGVKV